MPSETLRILLVHDAPTPDARPDELDSLAQAASFTETLHRLGHEVATLPCGFDLVPLAAALRQRTPDLLFNAMESLGGHSRMLATVPRLAESMGIPVAGCSAEGIHVSSNKLLAKRMLLNAGLPTPAWRTLAQLRAGQTLDGPVILKSVWEHASIGIDDDAVIQRVQSSRAEGGAGGAGSPVAEDLAARLAARLPKLGGEGFVESFIDGRELVVGLLPPAPGDDPSLPLVLPPSELEFINWPADKPRLMGFSSKWHEDSMEYAQTVRRLDFDASETPLLELLQRLAIGAWRTLDLGGHARVDFRVDREGRPWILEVNANPCLTPDAGFAAMLSKPGIGYDEAIDRIVRSAMSRHAAVARNGTLEPHGGVAASRSNEGGCGGGSLSESKRPPHRRRDEPSFRGGASAGDVAAVREMVKATGFFNDEEIAVAAELAQDAAELGAGSDFQFLFTDGPDGSPLGYACFGRIPLTASAWDLYWIVVAPEAQGRGLGQSLLRAVEAEVAARQGTHVYAETSGREQYAPTRAFYERCGYSLVARMFDFYAKGDDKLVYARQIGR